MRASGIAALLGAAVVLCACHSYVASGGGQNKSTAQISPICTQHAIGINSGAEFVSKRVRILAARFDFANNGGSGLGISAPPPGSYSAPSAGSIPTGQEANDIADAFELAPQYLQAELCLHVTKQASNGIPFNIPVEIYIDRWAQPPDAPFAWSFWEEPRKGQGTQYGRFIGISESLWSNPSFPQDLSGLEQFILEQLLGVSPPSGPHPALSDVVPSVAVSGVPNTVNNRALLLVAVLGREMGLIINRDRVQPGDYTDAVSPICNGKPFRDYSWITTLASKPLIGDIHKLGAEHRAATDHRRTQYVMPDMILDHLHLESPNYKAIATDISTVYGTQAYPGPPYNPEWADLLAEATPTDDFAETYRMMVLRDAVGKDAAGNYKLAVTLTFNDGRSDSTNVIANLGKGTLSYKTNCISNNFMN